jgi:transcriptional regulator with AAA-type ATPase domain
MLFSPADLSRAELISRIAHCNPFTPERIQLERNLLGRAYVNEDADWNVRGTLGRMPLNVERVHAEAERVLARALSRADQSPVASDEEWKLYRDVALFCLYHRYSDRFHDYLMTAEGQTRRAGKPRFYSNFAEDFWRIFTSAQLRPPHERTAAHYFACFFQIRRAFHQIYLRLHGRSAAAARLRAEIWHSIFTHDMRRYQRLLFERMTTHTTLITGPSGTGKELVARAIAFSCFIPFDESTGEFASDFRTAFSPVNLSALTPTLIESELFGHAKGAFTGAVAERAGWFELCGPYDAVFLDEIGEVAESIQVKLLRTLESRTFERLGESVSRSFRGKVIAATNRDLASAMEDGSFREDFYYRLCGDLIRTPSLREQLADDPAEIRNLIRFLALRLTSDEAESEALTCEVADWIEKHLPPDYPWPGNVRELDQCVRNILIRKTYQPQERRSSRTGEEQVNLTAQELLERYAARVYARAGSLDAAAKILQLDRRTVKKYVQTCLKTGDSLTGPDHALSPRTP